jgi:hypothetical protein
VVSQPSEILIYLVKFTLQIRISLCGAMRPSPLLELPESIRRQPREDVLIRDYADCLFGSGG